MVDTNKVLRWFFADLAEVKLAQKETGGAMVIVERVDPPGDMPRLHLHRLDDEARVVLEGEMSFYAGTDQPIHAAAGGLAFGPRGVRHSYRVDSSQPARWLAVCTPGDFEPFVVASSQAAPRAELPPLASPPTTGRSRQ